MKSGPTTEMFATPIPLLLGIALATAIIYWPGLGGDFALDDFPNIVLNQAITSASLSWDSIAAVATSSQAGPSGRPIAMLSFALNHLLGGLDPFGYKCVNLLIHLVNAILIFFLARRIIAAVPGDRGTDTSGANYGLAGLVALLWAVHPLNLTAVLYVVQRMTALSTTFMLIGLLGYLQLRLAGCFSWRRHGPLLLLTAASFCAAYLSKESALLLPVYALVLELSVLRFRCASRAGETLLKSAYFALALLPLAWLLWHWLQNPAWLEQQYRLRPYTAAERLMTESRVLWFYLREIFLPWPSVMGLFHDDFPISTGLLTPYTTLPAILGHALLLTLAWIYRARWPALALAVAWFYGGHLLESTIFPLEPVFEHRNYLPLLGPLLLVAITSWRATHGTPSRLALMALLTVPLLLVTTMRAQQWGDPLTLAISEAQHHPGSSRANYEAGSLLLNNLFQHPQNGGEQAMTVRSYLLRAAQTDANTLDPFVAGLQLQAAFGTPLPEEFYGEFLDRLAHAVPPSSYIEIAFGMKNLLQLPNQTLSDAQMRDLYEAALSNPRLVGINRSHMLVSYALFLKHRTRDYPRAAMLLEQAIRLAPGLQDFKILAAGVALQLQQPERAATLIAEAEAADKRGSYRELIAQARANLLAYRAATVHQQ